MTTGERLVEISTLVNGTAMNHFLNISTGGGECPPSIGGGGSMENVTIDDQIFLDSIEDIVKQINPSLNIPDIEIDDLDLDTDDINLDIDI